MSVVSGWLGADASKRAASTQAGAARDASELAAKTQLEMFKQGRLDTAPWREAGENALVDLQKKIAAGPGSFTKSPGYTARITEGEKAIERSAAARGSVLAPSTVKGLERYGQDFATNDYQNFLSNYYASLTPYQSLAGVGQTTAAQQAGLGQQTGANMANNYLQGGLAAGQAQAGGYINSANAITGAMNTGANNFLMWKYLNQPQYQSTSKSPSGWDDSTFDYGDYA